MRQQVVFNRNMPMTVYGVESRHFVTGFIEAVDEHGVLVRSARGMWGDTTYKGTVDLYLMRDRVSHIERRR